jgi:hypothetical protein
MQRRFINPLYEEEIKIERDSVLGEIQLTDSVMGNNLDDNDSGDNFNPGQINPRNYEFDGVIFDAPILA